MEVGLAPWIKEYLIVPSCGIRSRAIAAFSINQKHLEPLVSQLFSKNAASVSNGSILSLRWHEMHLVWVTWHKKKKKLLEFHKTGLLVRWRFHHILHLALEQHDDKKRLLVPFGLSTVLSPPHKPSDHDPNPMHPLDYKDYKHLGLVIDDSELKNCNEPCPLLPARSSQQIKPDSSWRDVHNHKWK